MLKAILIALMLLSCAKETPTQKVNIIPSKPYGVLIFETKSCIYCKQLKKDLSNANFKDFDIFWIDALGIKEVEQNLISGQKMREKDLSKSFNVDQFPYLLFYDKSGQVHLKLRGYLKQKELNCAMEFIRANVKIPYLQFAKEKCT
ncbi:MAG: thioredoxin fold domain-containing protein [Aquificaceae bacterium]|nr:thioredoxin fold domain-containing protein [Aquificaceae bacterium]